MTLPSGAIARLEQKLTSDRLLESRRCYSEYGNFGLILAIPHSVKSNRLPVRIAKNRASPSLPIGRDPSCQVQIARFLLSIPMVQKG